MKSNYLQQVTILEILSTSLDHDGVDVLMGAATALYSICTSSEWSDLKLLLPVSLRERLSPYCVKYKPDIRKFYDLPAFDLGVGVRSNIWELVSDLPTWIRRLFQTLLEGPSVNDRVLMSCLPLSLISIPFAQRIFRFVFIKYLESLTPSKAAEEAQKVNVALGHAEGNLSAARLILAALGVIRNLKQASVQTFFQGVDFLQASRAARLCNLPTLSLFMLELYIEKTYLSLSGVLSLDFLRENPEEARSLREVAEFCLSNVSDPDSFYGIELDPHDPRYCVLSSIT